MLVPVALSPLALHQLSSMQADGWLISWEQTTARLELIVERGPRRYTLGYASEFDASEWNATIQSLTDLIYSNPYNKLA